MVCPVFLKHDSIPSGNLERRRVVDVESGRLDHDIAFPLDPAGNDPLLRKPLDLRLDDRAVGLL